MRSFTGVAAAAAVLMLLCACEDSGSGGTPAVTLPYGMVTAPAQTGAVPETTVTTLLTTLSPVTNFTAMKKITFAEVKKPALREFTENGRLVPWGEKSASEVSTDED